MNDDRFQRMVARLEAHSQAHPGAYLLRVAGLALLGFGLLAVVLGLAGFGLLLIAGLVALALFNGAGALLLLAKFGKLLLVLALPMWFLLRSSLQALFVRLPAPQGEPLARHQAPVLFAAIDGMRRKLHGPRVHQVLLVDELNAAVLQRPLFGLVGFPRNHLLLGLPLLECLSADEALAVVAHEYGHLAGAHGRFGAFIYRLRLSWGTVQVVAGQWQGWLGRRLGRLVAIYAPYFNAYTFVLARANEYQADRCAADLVGPKVVADALKRINLATPRYQAFMGQLMGTVADQPQPPGDVAQRWAQAAAGSDGPSEQWLADALDRPGQALDTHPSLRHRLAALQADEAAAPTLPAARSGPSAAEAWLGGLLPTLRERFQARWAAQAATPWAERHQAIQGKRTRLAALRQLPQRSADEDFERLRLVNMLEPGIDLRDELAAFNARHAEHAPALYLEGSVRLDHGDASGLQWLERAMALDAEAIKPGCELALRHCQQHQDEAGAQAWMTRWRERDAFETLRQQQATQLDIRHPVQAAVLDDTARQVVQARLAGLNRKGIRAIYLVRRVLPADPMLATHVLAIQPSWWARRLGRQQALIDQVARYPWPMHLLICTLDGPRARYLKALRQVPGARLV